MIDTDSTFDEFKSKIAIATSHYINGHSVCGDKVLEEAWEGIFTTMSLARIGAEAFELIEEKIKNEYFNQNERKNI